MNRFYKPTGPRYTSQFVEEQYPADLMMGYMQMKAGQQANFAENVGKMQAEASLIPNGLRTEDMAPRVRNKWSSQISDWTTKNMNNYDSPQAIAELSSMRTQFMNDPDVLLLKQDYEDSNMYKQVKIKSGPSDVDPNVEDPNTGRLFQFEEGTPYSPYMPIIGDPGVPERILKEFSAVPTNKVSGSYLTYVKDPLTREDVRVEGQRMTDVTNKDQYNLTLQNMVERAVGNKEDWAVYQNAKFRNIYGRDMNEQEWYNFIAPIAARTVKGDYSDTRNYAAPSTSGVGDGQTGIGSGVVLDTPIIAKPEDSNLATRGNISQSSLNKKMNVDDLTDPRVKMLRSRLEKTDEWSGMTEKQRTKWMKDIVRDARDRDYSLQYEAYDPESEKDVNEFFGGAVNTKGIMDASVAGTKMTGQVIVDLDSGANLDNKQKEALAKENTAVRFLGRPTLESRKIAKYPGMILFDSNVGGESKQYAIKIPSLATQDKPVWNLYGHLRNDVTGVGDVYAVDFANDPNMMPQITDVSDQSVDGKPESVKAQTQQGLYVVPVSDVNPEKGYADVRVKVFKQNPTGTNVLDDNNELLVSEYWISDYPDVENGQYNPGRGIYRKMAQDFYSGKLRNK